MPSVSMDKLTVLMSIRKPLSTEYPMWPLTLQTSFMKMKNSLLRLNITLKTLLMISPALRKESTFAILITLIIMKAWMKTPKT